MRGGNRVGKRHESKVPAEGLAKNDLRFKRDDLYSAEILDSGVNKGKQVSLN